MGRSHGIASGCVITMRERFIVAKSRRVMMCDLSSGIDPLSSCSRTGEVNFVLRIVVSTRIGHVPVIEVLFDDVRNVSPMSLLVALSDRRDREKLWDKWKPGK